MVHPPFTRPCVRWSPTLVACRTRPHSRVTHDRQPTPSRAPKMLSRAASNSTHPCCSRTHSSGCPRRGGELDRPIVVNDSAANFVLSPQRRVLHHSSAPTRSFICTSSFAYIRASICLSIGPTCLVLVPCPSASGPCPHLPVRTCFSCRRRPSPAVTPPLFFHRLFPAPCSVDPTRTSPCRLRLVASLTSFRGDTCLLCPRIHGVPPLLCTVLHVRSDSAFVFLGVCR